MFLEWLSREGKGSPAHEGPSESGRPDAEDGGEKPTVSALLPRQTQRPSGDVDMYVERGAAKEGGFAKPEQETGRKRKRPPMRSNRQMADSLIEKAKSGMEKMLKREKRAFDPFAIQTIVSLCQRRAVDEKTLDQLLSKLEKAFKKQAKQVREESKVTVWMNWYYSACLRMILHLRGRGKRDRRANGAYIIHLIVNDLLATEGIDALSVIAAYAGKTGQCWMLRRKLMATEHNHTLSEASNTSEASQVEISGMVADGLRDHLTSPPDHYLMPNAAVWISTVTKVRYTPHLSH